MSQHGGALFSLPLPTTFRFRPFLFLRPLSLQRAQPLMPNLLPASSTCHPQMNAAALEQTRHGLPFFVLINP
jgi:hypothetical protein